MSIVIAIDCSRLSGRIPFAANRFFWCQDLQKKQKLKNRPKIEDGTIFFLSDGGDRGDGMGENEGSFEDRGGEGRMVGGKWRKKGGKLEVLQIWDDWSKTGPQKRF